MKNTSRFIVICFSLIFLLIFSLYLLNDLFPKNPGPKRTIIYFPNKSAWLVIDELKNKGAKIDSYFHTKEAISFLSENKALIHDYKNKLLAIGLSGTKIDTISLYNCYSDQEKTSIYSSSKDRCVTTFFLFYDDSSKIHYSKNDQIEKISYKDIEYFFVLNNKKYNRIGETALYTDAKKVIILREKNEITQFILIEAKRAIYKEETIINHSETSSIKGIWDKGNWKISDYRQASKQINKAPNLKSVCTNSLGNYNSGYNYNWRCDSNLLAQKYEKEKFSDIVFSKNTYKMFRSEPGNFKYMINNYRSVVKDISSPERYREKDKGMITSYAALIARIDNNEELLSWVKNSLKNINRNKRETFILNYAESLWSYCTAYSFIRPILIPEENREIYKEIYEYALELEKIYEVTNVNNWRLKIASVLGFAGILLNNHQWIEKAVNHIDHYLDFGIKEGVCYEGNFYLSYGFRYVPLLLSYFKDLDINIIDFTKDERYQQLIAVLIAQIAPNNTFPCFEDCTRKVKKDLLEFISLHSKLFYSTAKEENNPDLIILSQLCKRVGMNNLIFPYKYWLPDTRLYINDTLSLLEINIKYLKKWIPNSTYTGSFILNNGGLSILRNKKNTEMLSISAKQYEQTHTHMDELSIELWIKGKVWLTNPGYNGFGEKYHSYTTSSIASNTICINDQNQINSHGAFFQDFCFMENVQMLTADGSDLFVHPQRNLLKNCYLYVLISFIMISITIKLYIDSVKK